MKPAQFRPMLSATLEAVENLHSWSELWASPKLDGIRCLILGGQAVSRNLKPIPNRYIQQKLKGLPDGLDGELIVGSPCGEGVFNRTTSGVMSHDGEPYFTFWVFDTVVHPLLGWVQRAELVRAQIALGQALDPDLWGYVQQVPQQQVRSIEEVTNYEAQCLNAGYEGIMIRRASQGYKYGRATHREGGLWKLKRFRDGEAIITGIEEGQQNTNLPERAPDGSIERSTHKAGMLPNGQVGTIIGRDVETGKTIRASPGRMTHDERRKYFQAPHLLIGQIMKYKVFDYGSVNEPRFCTFQGLRSPIDM
ncbi:MAG: ATP-dependent DNA ligase [Desulfurellales bacterium]|nr:MAG: ATP-dependent DNA ligase [Desulfurellales bacterium]